MVYDLGTESRGPGEGDVGEETGQTRPALLYDAHDGRLTPLSNDLY